MTALHTPAAEQSPPAPSFPNLPGRESIPGLIWAFRVHTDGTPEELPVEQPIDDRHDGWLWLHFNLADARAQLWLASEAGLAPAAANLLLSSDHHQQLHAKDACVYGVISDIVRQFDHATDQIGHLHFVMTDRWVISGRHHTLHAIEATRQALREGRRLTSMAALLETIVEHVADAIDGVVDKLGDELDRIEDRVVDDTLRDERSKLGRLRRTAVRLHRQLAGLRSLFHRIERNGTLSSTPLLQVATTALVQRLDGLDHEVIAMRDRAHLLQEGVSGKLAEESARNLQVLSILTALLLPPTLITGVFGMNVKGLPFTEDTTGFLWALVLIALSSASAYWLLRRMGIARRD